MSLREQLDRYEELAGEREALRRRRGDHSTTSRAWSTLMRRDTALSAEALELAATIRADHGVDPNAERRKR